MGSESTEEGQCYAVVIGDIVESRGYDDQTALFAVVTEILEHVSTQVEATQPLQMTIGDEFQGAYATLGSALDACLLIRLHLQSTCDTRIGIGWGEISSFDPARAPMAQSGSAWWRAREAIEVIERAVTSHAWPRGARTWVAGAPTEMVHTLNAFLLCRDQLLDAMDTRDYRIVLGMLLGERQVDLAAELGITQPAISQRQHDSGAVAVLQAHRLLRGLRP